MANDCFCDLCDRWFGSWQALNQHRQDSLRHPYCSDCDRHFGSWEALDQHRLNSSRHAYFSYSKPQSGSWEALDQEGEDSAHHAYCDCWDCEGHFGSPEAHDQHREDSRRHPYCFKCQEEFWIQEDPQTHPIESYNHSWCEICGDDHDEEDDLRQHMEDEHMQCHQCFTWCEDYAAYQSHAENHQYYCKPCDRFFSSVLGFASHLDFSALHNPKKFKCPFCPRKGVSVSSIVVHLESGCHPKFTRAVIDDFIARHDRKNVVTNPSRSITSASGESRPAPMAHYEATDAAYSHVAGAYVCYFCPCQFRELQKLNQHLASPKHTKRDQKLYRCPGITCHVETETLSGVVQHIETAGCGVRESKVGRGAMDQLEAGLQRMSILSS